MKIFIPSLLLIALLVPFSALALEANTVGQPGANNVGQPQANTIGQPTSVRLDNPLGNITGFCGFIKMLFVTIGTIAVPIAVLFLVYAGFKFVWARGNPTGLEEAKKNIFYTILGIAIFFAAWLLALAIGNTLASFGVSVIGNC